MQSYQISLSPLVLLVITYYSHDCVAQVCKVCKECNEMGSCALYESDCTDFCVGKDFHARRNVCSSGLQLQVTFVMTVGGMLLCVLLYMGVLICVFSMKYSKALKRRKVKRFKLAELAKNAMEKLSTPMSSTRSRGTIRSTRDDPQPGPYQGPEETDPKSKSAKFDPEFKIFKDAF